MDRAESGDNPATVLDEILNANTNTIATARQSGQLGKQTGLGFTARTTAGITYTSFGSDRGGCGRLSFQLHARLVCESLNHFWGYT
jgi:hypothetical protein